MKTKFFHLFAVFVLSLSLLCSEVSAQHKPAAAKPITATVNVFATDNSPAGRRMAAFNMAWSVLNEKYFDKTFGGLDWEKVRKEFQPRVAATKTDAEFHYVLKEMIDRLGKSHLNIIVPEYFEKLEIAKKQARTRGKQLAAERRLSHATGAAEDAFDDDDQIADPDGARYGIGVELRMLDDQLVITHVDAQSGATIAGLKPGYIIDKINGVAMSKIVELALINGNSAKDLRYLLPYDIVESFLNGLRETSVFVTCLDENNTVREFTVPRLRLEGESISISKNLPEQFLKFESRLLSPDIGYIKFNAFAMPVVGKFCDSLTGFLDKKAIIIDLRGNLGGIIGSMIGLSGMLTDKPFTLGTFRTRAGVEPFIVAAKNKHFKGRVVVLVDSDSMSATEMFTAGLQGSRGAVVVGERTGGKSLPAIWTKLPTGAIMMYPIADFITTRGSSLEGIGLLPDRVVALDRKSLLLGEDVQLKAAISAAGDDGAFSKALKTEQPAQVKSSDDPPPPPPPKAMPRPVPAALTTPGPSDARSIKVIAEFAAAAGGVDAVKSIASYEAKGSAMYGPDRETESEIYAARQFPDKALIMLSSASTGEIREIYNGKKSYIQSDFGVDRNLYPNIDTTRFQLLQPFFDVLEPDYLKGLKYEGEYEVDGHMRRVLSAIGPKGVAVGLSFDSGTKMLVSYSAPGILYMLDDYRKVDGVMLPFHIDLDRAMDVHLTSLTINSKLDPGNFEKKVRCFDKEN